MITFDSYSPQTWLDRCLIVRPDIKKTHMSKPQKRTGRWSSVLSVGVVTASLFVSTVELPHTPIGIADTGVFARKIDRGLFGPDDHFVPQGYWERLGAAIKLANRLPDQEISKDPPVMVQYVADCWASDLKTDLSQGDLLSLVLVGTAAEPKTALTRGPTRKKGLESWDTSAWKADGDDFGYFLARGREVHVVVVSEDCEIDKDDGKIPVLVAPVFSQDALQTDDARQAVLQGRRFPFLAVEAIPDVIPASYVDLRSITFINRKLMARARRKKSMSSIGVNSLIQQIIAFFTHISVDELRTANRIDEKQIKRHLKTVGGRVKEVQWPQNGSGSESQPLRQTARTHVTS